MTLNQLNAQTCSFCWFSVVNYRTLFFRDIVLCNWEFITQHSGVYVVASSQRSLLQRNASLHGLETPDNQHSVMEFSDL